MADDHRLVEREKAAEARTRLQLLEWVGLPDPARR
jgi:hypothetical protein